MLALLPLTFRQVTGRGPWIPPMMLLTCTAPVGFSPEGPL
jgi:hypothetical protein